MEQNINNNDNNEVANNDNLAAAQALMDNNRALGTVKLYTSKIKGMIAYFRESGAHSALVREEELVVPLPNEAVMEYFGHLSKIVGKKRVVDVDEEEDDDEDGEVPMLASSTVKGYISALKWHYKKKNAEIDPSLAKALEAYAQGYTRKVATLKKQGATSLV
jgi:hypothetical protein